MRLKADLTLLLAALVWGLGFIAQRNAALEVGALLFNAARWTLGGLVMLPFIRFNLHLDRKTIPWMAAGGFILFAASGLQQAGLEFTTAGNAGFITGTYVVIIPILLTIFWKERSNWTIWLAAFMTTIGIYMLGSGGVLRFNWGDGIVLIGAVLWALHVIVTGKGVKHVPVSGFCHRSIPGLWNFEYDLRIGLPMGFFTCPPSSLAVDPLPCTNLHGSWLHPTGIWTATCPTRGCSHHPESRGGIRCFIWMADPLREVDTNSGCWLLPDHGGNPYFTVINFKTCENGSVGLNCYSSCSRSE